MYDKLRRIRRLDAVQSDCSALSIVKQGDLMVVANVGDSRGVLGTAFDDDVITSSSSSSTLGMKVGWENPVPTVIV
jgi:serine/threonine protein phosphatase PrpC